MASKPGKAAGDDGLRRRAPMVQNRRMGKSERNRKSGKDERAARLAEALRANLKRRKEQARKRKGQSAPPATRKPRP